MAKTFSELRESDQRDVGYIVEPKAANPQQIELRWELSV